MTEHEPVLLGRVIDLLRSHGSWNVEGEPEASQGRTETAVRDAKLIDGTLGLGGYSEAILRSFPQLQVCALDRDKTALDFARTRLAEFGERFQALHAEFGDMEEVWGSEAPFEAFVFDLGVSNMQLTEADRGFSFQNDGPLDMRMNPDGSAPTAAELLEKLETAELSRIFWEYGEERFSRKIAAGIDESRRQGKTPRTTNELVELIRDVLPAPVQRKMGTHPARRVFQALRIYLNDELGELERALEAVKRMASPEAVVVVVSYHSLEDRIVKHTFRAWAQEEKKGVVLTKHPEIPDEEEIARNFKARSAKLRAFKFTKTTKRPGRKWNSGVENGRAP